MNFKVKKIALFGTSADPPTIGHKKILKDLAGIFDCVICYASNNPSKKHGADLSLRGTLLQTLINDLNNPNILYDQEISSSWAINSVNKSIEKYNLNKISFVIGSDLLQQIPSWKDIDKIISKVIFFIIPREGYPINHSNLKFIKESKGGYVLSTLQVPKISSSTIRSNTQHPFLPRSLVPIVKANNLYNSSKMEE